MKISVALCTYNGEKYLQQQLESIFQQSHPVDEIVVCDDGSSDNTLSVLIAFQKRYPQVLVIHENPENLGGRKNFEKCFGLCSGDVIFFSDQDDIWHLDKVQKTIAFFKEDETCLGIATNARLIGEDGGNLQKGFWESFDFSTKDLKVMTTLGVGEFILTNYNMVAGAMLAVRKEARPYIFPFRFPCGIWHDEWITISLSATGKMKLVDDKLVDYRVHSGQQMGVGNDSTDLALWAKKLKSKDMLRADPDFYLSHAWSSYHKLKQLQTDLPNLKFNVLEKSLHQRLQDAKQQFLRKQNFLFRKARLLKWYTERKFVTSLRDVVTM